MKIKERFENHEVRYKKEDGSIVSKEVRISIIWDEDFNEWIIPEKSLKILEQTKAQLKGFLTEDEYEGLIKRHGFTRAELDALFEKNSLDCWDKIANLWETTCTHPFSQANTEKVEYPSWTKANITSEVDNNYLKEKEYDFYSHSSSYPVQTKAETLAA